MMKPIARKSYRSIHLNGGAVNRPISRSAWVFLILASLGAFFVFMVMDPEPSFLLSISITANIAIMLWAIYRLYQMDLLLSPMSTAVIGPAMLIYYTFGNLGSRIAGENRYNSNYGSLHYYPLAAFLTACGLALFCWCIFFIFGKRLSEQRFRYQDMSWNPGQALLTTLVAGGIIFYLSNKYPFINGYFYGAVSNVDRWFIASYLFFIVLAGLVDLSVMIKSRRKSSRLIGLFLLIFLLASVISVRSRTFLLNFIIFMGLAWVTLKPDRIKTILVLGTVAVLITYPLVTVIKTVSVRGQTSSLMGNLASLLDIDLTTLLEMNQSSAAVDVQYRTAGLEHPAALLLAYDRNASPMYGDAFISGLLSALPGFLRPANAITEREAILSHFNKYGLFFGDSIGVPLSSGLADLGIIFSPLIYLVIGVFCVWLWRIGQLSPQLYLAVIVIWMRVDPVDLFWEDGLFSLRSMVFIWIVLLIVNSLIKPTWNVIRDNSTGVHQRQLNNTR